MDMGKSLQPEMSGGESSAIDYDVFLSFKGPDTRQEFMDCLYNGMLEANIRVFFEEEELNVRKEIDVELSTAIEKSKIYLPILSKGYASCPQCLNELAHIVDCTKSKPSEKEIMPIFYDVKYCDVKLVFEQYLGGLGKDEKKFGRQMRLKWEDALKSVAKIKGWELKRQGQWKFIKLMTREILMKLKIRDKRIPEYLVGMDDRVEAALKLLDVESGGRPFLLIHGMGGIGKTTFAKVLFNKLNSMFTHCCFLQDVRETSHMFGFETLQKRLLSDMFGSGFHDMINDVDDGIKLITKQLSNRKVFVVLDDVDNEEQLEKLSIKHISFALGSRVIMTTRNTSLVVVPDQTLEYEMKSLNPVQSLELFSRHAFGINAPPDDYVSLSRHVVSTTGGLPLALEVIGSLLRPQNKALWIDVLDNLREVPHEKVHDKLKISYNALSFEQKQIFLDIACFFIDKDTTNAFYMWKDCRFSPDYSTQVLICMSLIKITDQNKFWMHDQLRDLGRKIVREGLDPRKHSRLWVPEMTIDVIRTEKRKEAIEAICLPINEPEIYTSEEFSRLPNIRFLKLGGGYLEGDFKNQLSRLRYMSWNLCPHKFSAINFHLINLVVLNLSCSFITEDWTGWSQIKFAKKLKVLDLSHCHYMTRTPSFSDYLSLERLILMNCARLKNIDDSIDKLRCLIYFNLERCGSLIELRKLPESIASVASLVELDLSNTAITRLPDSIGDQKHLSVLKLQGTNIDELPYSIGNLQELKYLFLSRTNVKGLPMSIWNLESLLELDVSRTQCVRIPESIGNLSRLKVINVSYSPIRGLPQSIVALKELEELHAENCSYLKWEIPEGIWKLSLLRVLHLQLTLIKNVPETIQLLPRLEILSLRHCAELEVLSHLPTSLVSLSFGSSSLRWVSDLSNLTKLTDMSYAGHDANCYPLFFQDGPCQQSLVFLPPSLSTLSLEYHQLMTRLSFGCDLRNLTRLRMYECRWKEIQLDGLKQLIEFDAEGLKFLQRFSGLSNLKRLKLLRLSDCPNLSAIQGLLLVSSLEQLEIQECPKIVSLDDLSKLKKLKSLKIRGCEELLRVEGLDEVETLIKLALIRCGSLRNFSNGFIWKVQDECSLTILDCPNLEDDGIFEEKVSMYKQRKVREERGIERGEKRKYLA